MKFYCKHIGIIVLGLFILSGCVFEDINPCEREKLIYEIQLEELYSSADKVPKEAVLKLQKRYHKALERVGCEIPIE